MKEKMSRWGVGPKFMALSIGYVIIEETFGSKYVTYKKEVPAILPIGWIRSRKKASAN